MERTRLALNAMATRFEIVIVSGDGPRARAAGEEALAEIARIERQLSFYDPSSWLSALNRSAAQAEARVPAPLFDLLERARVLSGQTGGAFDPTMGARMAGVKGEWTGSETTPQPHRKASIPPDSKAMTPSPGMAAVLANPSLRAFRFTNPEIKLDLGGIGKGYAIDEAMALLRDAGMANALIHGGTSTARAIGTDAGNPWRIAVAHPHPERSLELLATWDLADQALSVSGIFGSGRLEAGRWLGHVIDPRTGESVSGTELAAVVADTATDADALSTALLVLGDPSNAMAAFGTLPTLALKADGTLRHRGSWRLERDS